MKARLLDMGSVSPLRSQSIYHAITSCMRPDSDVAITLMRPNARYVSIGYFQEAGREVDLAYCAENRLPVIRRHVGGGAVLLDEDQLFFHVMLPSARAREFGLPLNLRERFEYLARPPIAAYRELGVEADFKPINDIHVKGRKIGGTGVGEIEEGLVFAGSMMFDFNTTLMARVLNIPDEKMRDKISESLESYMSTMVKELGMRPALEIVAEALTKAFEQTYGLELIPSMPTPEEMDALYQWDEQLIDEQWLHGVRLKPEKHRAVKIAAEVHVLHAQHKAPGGLIRATVRVANGQIEDVLISGDFPVTPKDALHSLAARFEGANLDRSELEKRIAAAFDSRSFEFAGVEAADFSTLFQQIIPR